MTAAELYSIEITEWNRILDFYATEISIFRERLAEVAAKNNKAGVTAAIEHFQNQFIVQEEVLQTLRHDANKQKNTIIDFVKQLGNIGSIDVVDIQFLLRDRMHMEEKILVELKHSFYRFLAKVL